MGHKPLSDSVPHAELLYKLWLMGITGSLLCLFRDYLTNRKHFVEVMESSQRYSQLHLVFLKVASLDLSSSFYM